MKKLRCKRRKTEGGSICIPLSSISKSDTSMDSERVDYFSRLPDTVMTQIFYSLQMKETIGTCMLSKNLSRLMSSIPNLEFKDFVGPKTSEKVRKKVETINNFLEHRNGPIRSCRLLLRSHCYDIHFGRWITLLVENGIEELDLDLLEANTPIELPSCLFSSKFLRVLKLKSCILRLPPVLAGLCALETLALRSMPLSEDLIHTLLSQCNRLRSLTIQNCVNIQKFDIPDCNSSLESLTLENCFSHIALEARNIKNLSLRGEKMSFSVKVAQNLVNASIFRNNRLLVNRQEGNSLKDKVLIKLLYVQNLSLTGWAFKCFAAGHLEERMQVSYTRMKKLELEVSSWNVKELEGMVCLFRSCPNAENLVLWINEDVADENDYGNYEREIDDVESYWEELDEDYGCVDTGFQWIEINNFSGLDTEVRLVKFLAANTRWLRTITITPVEEMDANQQLGFANLFKRLSRPCIDTRIVVNQVKPNV